MNRTPPGSAVRRLRRAVRAPIVAVALLAGSMSHTVSAELRVLLAFDASGHRIHQVTRTGGADETLTTYVPPSVDPDAAARNGDATLTWLDADGAVLSIVRARDPRVGHAPAPGGDHAATSPGRPIALAEGGWLVRGPDSATELLLRLPPVGDPALPPEAWRLFIDAD